MARNERANIAEHTLRILEKGEYIAPSGKVVRIQEFVSDAKEGTRLYDLSVLERTVARRSLPTIISVTAETTCEAIARLHHTGSGHLCALNFASAKNPGGGFLGGAQAQEEALARSSALYQCLLQQPTYYERNRSNRSALYLDLAIFSPAIPFFRDDAGNLLECPTRCSVLTVPAPNAGAVRQNQPQDIALIAPALRRRAELVLATAAAENVERLVLGAWGCGVFRNEPTVVAAAFAELLLGGGQFRDVFSDVVFAIFDRTPNTTALGAFRAKFSD